MPVNDFDDVLNAPGVDLTGKDPRNKITLEDQMLNPPQYRDHHYIVPAEGPIFENDVEVYRVSTAPNGGEVLTPLLKGTDWYLTHRYMEASYYLGDASPPKQLYASISFYDLELVGRLKITYQKLGGPFSINANQLLALLGARIYNPRICSFEQIAGVYVRFPPTDHPTDANTIEWGTTEVSQRLAGIEQAIMTRIGPPVYTVDQMNNLLDQMNENHQAEKAELLAEIQRLHAELHAEVGGVKTTVKAELLAEIQRLRAELHAELDAVKTTVNTEAYLNSGD